MVSVRGTVYNRSDLNKQSRNVPFDKVDWYMLAIQNTGVILADDIVLFVDEDGKTKILKSRHGKLA